MSLRPLMSTLRLFRSHPLTRDDLGGVLKRFVRWQVISRLLGEPVLMPFVNDTRLITTPGETGVTGNVYCGLHEFEDMAFALHLLRPGDWFHDVGANVGSFTVLGAATGAQVLAFEPIPSTFARLTANVRTNRFDALVRAENCGVAESAGVLRFISNQNTINRVATAEDGEDSGVIEVPVHRLDDYLAECPPTLIKIDVEGFETEVLNGARATLASPGLHGLIVELNEGGRRFGHESGDIAAFIRAQGFAPHAYDPLTRMLTPLADNATGAGIADNQIFVRDVDWVRHRLATAPKFKVIGREI